MVPSTPDVARIALLHDLTRWREQISRTLARNNLALRSEGIAMATNRIILSLLFLRIAQDRGLLSGDVLQGLHDSPDPYGQLLEITAPLSVLWEDRTTAPDQDPVPMGTLVYDGRLIHAILSRLVAPDRPYRFDSFGTEPLAEVLAQYLERTIRRSAAHHADVVDTRDSVLSCGSARPPLSVIRYLAESSVRAAIDGRSEDELLPLRIVDPACGSGTLLLCAYRAICDRQGAVTYDERYAILTGSVHGVDISRHAVAVIKILLFFQLCETCCREKSPDEFLLHAAGVLRDLRHTIRCGNAIIGPDIVDDESWSFCPVRDRHTLTPFSWSREFPEIFAAGGFDAVIMNPPAGQPEQKEWIQRYLQRHYAAYDPAAERSFFFIENSLSLLRPGGTLGVCMPDRWLRGRTAAPFRFLLAARQVEEIVDIREDAGGSGAGGLVVLLLSNRALDHRPCVALVPSGFSGDIGEYVVSHAFPLDQDALGEGGWALRDTRTEAVLEKVSRYSTPLEEYVMGQVYAGIRIADDDPFVIDETLAREWLRRDPRSKSFLRRIVAGAAIGRYQSGQPEKFLLLIPKGWTLTHQHAVKNPWQWFRHRHPLIARYLQPFSTILKARSGPDALWWEMACDAFWQDPQKKILFPAHFHRPAFWPDSGRGLGDETICAIPSADQYLAGILNSRLIAFVFNRTVQEQRPDQEFFSWEDLVHLPIYTPDLDRPEDRSRHERLEKLVLRRIDLEKNFRHARTDPEREILQKKIRTTDVQIEAVVSDLYGLTEEEIAVVESALTEDSPS